MIVHSGLKRWWIGLICLFYGLNNAHSQQQLLIITTDQYSFSQDTLTQQDVASMTRLINIDELERIEQQLNAQLPKDEVRARHLLDQRLPAVQDTLAAAFSAGLLIHQWQLRYLPAIIFNHGEAVYYGRDVQRAMQLWRLQQAGRGKP